MAIIPFTVAMLAIAISIEFGHNIRCGLVHNMKVSEEHPGERADRAQLHHSMSQCAVLIHPTLLIVLGIISESSENLEDRYISSRGTSPCVQTVTYWHPFT